MFILWWIIVGLIAGFITGKLMKGTGFGTIGDIVVGIVGAIVGGFIMRALGFAGQGNDLHHHCGCGRCRSSHIAYSPGETRLKSRSGSCLVDTALNLAGDPSMSRPPACGSVVADLRVCGSEGLSKQ